MSTQAVASGPIGFTDPATGKFISVPITALKFTDSGIYAGDWPNYNSASALYQEKLDAWLQYLVQIGQITRGVTAAPQPAMQIKAAVEGTPGNAVKVEFSNIIVVDQNDPTKTKFDAKITEKHEYVGLKPETIQSIIGTETVRGSQPGLVTILEADQPALPAANVYYLTDDDADTKFQADIPKYDGNVDAPAFTVVARSAGAAGQNITVTIADVNNTTNTFKLIAEYYEASIGPLTTDDLKNTGLGLAGARGAEFVIIITPPEGETEFGVPAAGVVALSGGAERAEAKSAAATIFTAP